MDSNSDGMVSTEEVETLTGEVRDAVLSADRNQDGRVDSQELYGVVSRSVELFRRVVDESE